MAGSVVVWLVLVPAVLAAVHVATLLGHIRLAVVVLFFGLAAAPTLRALRRGGRRRPRFAMMAATLLFVGMAVAAWPGLDGRAALLLPPFLGYMLTSALFARSLLPGRVPVIVHMCRFSRGDPLPEGLESYARAVTWGWAVLPAVLGLGAMAVFGILGLEVWSWVSNVANPIALVAFFIGEHIYRAWRLPHLDKPSLARTFDVMLNANSWFRRP